MENAVCAIMAPIRKVVAGMASFLIACSLFKEEHKKKKRKHNGGYQINLL